MGSDTLFNRRKFLKSSAAVIGAVVATAATEGLAQTAAPSKGIKWDEEYDVIVVGSGMASTVAAISAVTNGAKTVMLEKMSVPGGSSAISNATIAVLNSDLQEKYGVKDSAELFISDLNKRSQGMSQPELVEALVKNSTDAYKLIKANGATFNDYVLALGHSVPRVMQPTKNGEVGIMAPVRTSYIAKGGKLVTRCKVDEIVLNEKGDAIGVKVRTNYHFDRNLYSDDIENMSGDVKYIKAKKGIVCGTGGYVADKQFRSQEYPHLNSLPTSQQVGATASGWKLLADSGARMVHSSLFQYSFPMSAADMSYGPIVDVNTGKRVFSETITGANMAVEIAKLLDKNGGKLPVAIIDSRAYEKHIEDKVQFVTNTNAGFNSVHTTVEDFAKHYNIPVDAFKETMKKYNQYVADKKDPEFNKDFAKIEYLDVSVPPYYGMVARPNFNYSLGGALINKDAQVISLKKGTPINGLYAAGEATGGVFGAGRMSGCSIADGCTFGMIAGKNAATRKI